MSLPRLHFPGISYHVVRSLVFESAIYSLSLSLFPIFAPFLDSLTPSDEIFMKERSETRGKTVPQVQFWGERGIPRWVREREKRVEAGREEEQDGEEE